MPPTPNRGRSYLAVEMLRQAARRITSIVAESRHPRLNLAQGSAANNVLSPGEARGSILKAWQPFWGHFRQFLGFRAWPCISISDPFRNFGNSVFQ